MCLHSAPLPPHTLRQLNPRVYQYPILHLTPPLPEKPTRLPPGKSHFRYNLPPLLRSQPQPQLQHLCPPRTQSMMTLLPERFASVHTFVACVRTCVGNNVNMSAGILQCVYKYAKALTHSLALYLSISPTYHLSISVDATGQTEHSLFGAVGIRHQ